VRLREPSAQERSHELRLLAARDRRGRRNVQENGRNAVLAASAQQRVVRALAHVAARVVREPHVVRARLAQQPREPAHVDFGVQRRSDAAAELRARDAVVVDALGREHAARALFEAEPTRALHAQAQQQHGPLARVARDEALDLARRAAERNRQLAREHAHTARRLALERGRDDAAGIEAALLEGAKAGDEHEG
jgi:hypothetical protein